MAGYDLELLRLLFDSNIQILLVGDPRQRTYSTSNSTKNKRYRKSSILNFFEDNSINIDKDEQQLTINYRSISVICDLSNKLFPDHIYYDIKLNNAHTSITVVGTHSIVVSNAGGAAARNVRIAHSTLPHYKVIPSTSYEVIDLPGGGKELLFSNLVPNEQITVSYLYEPPTKYSDVNTYIKSDEGLAQYINIIPKPNLLMWQKSMIWVLSFIGGMAVIYVILILLLHIMEIVYSSLCYIK